MSPRRAASHHREPVSQLALWARGLAIFALVATLLSIIVVRFGFLEIRPALATFLGAIGCAALAILVAIAAFIAIWRNGSRGLGHIALALLISTVILFYPAYLATRLRSLPAIHDITTDPIDPPRFETLARLRGTDGANPAAYAGLYTAEQQREAYPDIEPLELDVSPQKAYDIALDLITKRKWRIVDARPPQPPRREGHIEAVARTPVMGFRDDVVVRVLPNSDGARVDLRSASRYFQHDLGANAKRVMTLMEDLTSLAEAVKPDNKPAPKSVQPGKGVSRR